MSEKEFHTFSGYMKKEGGLLTASMEDYLEMIYRLSKDSGFTRINDLALALNVQPPSATKMVQKLAESQMVDYEKYGIILLSEKGRQLGEHLLFRHEVVQDFLTMLGVDGNVLEETEKIEHTISTQTLKAMAHFVSFLKSRSDMLTAFKTYQTKQKESG